MTDTASRGGKRHTDRLSSAIGSDHLIGNDGKARVDLRIVAGVVDADALVAVAPVPLEPRKEMLSRNDQHAACFETLVELLRSDG